MLNVSVLDHSLIRCVCLTVQVDLVCHGKTEVFPDQDGVDPYAVSTLLNTGDIMHKAALTIQLSPFFKVVWGQQTA